MAMLSQGSKGEEVRKLQTALNRAGSNLSVDGIYGEKTKQAVCNFQDDNGLKVDGICGAATWEALTPYMFDLSILREAIEDCLIAVEQLPEYNRLEALLYG